MTFYGKAMLYQEDRMSRSDRARQHVEEQEEMSQSQCSILFVSCAVQKVMLVGCDWWFLIRIFVL